MNNKYIFTPFLKGTDEISTVLSSLSSSLSGNNIYISSYIETQLNNVSCALTVELSSISTDLSNAISNKIWIDDRVNCEVSGTSDLSIIKINKDDFDALVINEHSMMSANTLYIIDSNYIDAYGQAISNVIMSSDGIREEAQMPSEAANKNYVDAICSDIYSEIKNNSNIYLSSISSDSEIDGGILNRLNIIKFDTLQAFEQNKELVTLSDLVLINEDQLNAGNDRVISVALPEHPTDAANKQYVDQCIFGNLSSISSDVCISTFVNAISNDNKVDPIDIELAVSALYRLVKILGGYQDDNHIQQQTD